ncbi:MAG TPA: class I SAM-dependent methyltransferase [Bacteroidia bacterium]
MRLALIKIALVISKVFLFVGIPFTFLATLWLKLVKKARPGVIEDSIFMSLGVLPVQDHYYEPMINPKKHLRKSLSDNRALNGIDLNVKEQLDLLASFNYNDELLKFPKEKTANKEYYYNNTSYAAGDSEYYYNLIRKVKPKKIIEVGCGNSTLMAQNAIKKNKEEDSAYFCKHICIEPYEQPWLEQLGIDVIRKKVEDVDLAFFQQLGKDDILFIDSSHMIRAQGDVLFEYLELIPTVKPGVIVHVHDIFTPKDYPQTWVVDYHLFWNEQYLLEAFLTNNSQFRIIGALNYLKHNHREAIEAKCPILASHPEKEPGAFWMVKI